MLGDPKALLTRTNKGIYYRRRFNMPTEIKRSNKCFSF
jgi:hypothetical protein